MAQEGKCKDKGGGDQPNKRIPKREKTFSRETPWEEKRVLPKNQEGHRGDAHVSLAPGPVIASALW